MGHRQRRTRDEVMRVILRSPLAGWSSSLDEAPDEVFSGRLLGDGVLIDPTGHELFSPCDGEIISVAASKHAIAVRSEAGVEILMHVGIDTVNLGGAGFDVHVNPGMRVGAGTKLMTFDLDFLARNAKSLVTPIIITNSERVVITRAEFDRELTVGDTLFEVQVNVSAGNRNEPSLDVFEETLRIHHPHGIHARPAALIANAAKKYGSVQIIAHGKPANAASPVAMMSLGIRVHDEILIRATGPNARAAVEAVRNVIERLPVHSDPRVATKPSDPSDSNATNQLRGVVASRGLAIGKAFQFRRAEIEIAERGGSVEHERAELIRATTEVRGALQQSSMSAGSVAREILEAHLELLDDPELTGAATEFINAGKSAGFAWRRAIRSFAERFAAMDDSRMAERVDDLLDLEHQVIAALMNVVPLARQQLPENAVLVATDLQPSQFVALDKSKLAAICLATGGPTSHVAILAAATGVPMLVALGKRMANVANGESLIVDAEQGVLHLVPSDPDLVATAKLLEARRQERETQRAHAQRECRTADGVRIEVFANLGSLEDATIAVSQGAEGCGLLRTEFLFLDRDQAPDEQQQLNCYQQIADELAGRPLIIRTLDVGGDKPIAYLPLPTEENPALGLRGIRTSLWQPELLRIQLRAIMSVKPRGQCRVLLPMITDIEEIRTVRRLISVLSRELRVDADPSVGIMIETPASAVLADQLAREVDFFSIGTNDLTQYTLAMDRGHAALAPRIDGLHPAVLRLIAQTCEAGAKHHRLVAVCGGLASDPVAVPVLVGLGVRELSAVPTAIPEIKHLIASMTMDECRTLAEQALQLESADAVRSSIKDAPRSSANTIATVQKSASAH
jgi:phosphocarrier protein FPr/phosphocarrier protein